MSEHATGGRSDDPMLGATLLGRYRVLRKLGEGGMGSVYEAENVLLGRRVAIKCLLPKLSRDPESVARFVREAQAATLIAHPHIVQVFDLDALPDGTRFMVLELLDGNDLGSELDRSGTIPLPRTLSITLQVCDALAAAHRAGVVHRDIKPPNVFLVRRDGRDDYVKVVDFGIARLVEPDGPSNLTRTGTLLGTPYYMAPEQVQARKDLDHRVDVYALGVMLFECLTGRPPFDAASFGELVVQITQQPAPLLRTLRPDLPVALEALVAGMLAKRREDRPNDLDEVRMELGPVAAWAATASSAPTTELPTLSQSTTGPLRDPGANRTRTVARADEGESPRARPGRWKLALASGTLALLLVALASATILLVTRRRATPPAADAPSVVAPAAPTAPRAPRARPAIAPPNAPLAPPVVITAPAIVPPEPEPLLDPSGAAPPAARSTPSPRRTVRPPRAASTTTTPSRSSTPGRGLITSFPD
ncbi:MAG: serine/threonine protein kinase [Deltaproteobacteria bacterium]|nr:serine/threonine protein kinase [Deltaproteobacteria bacterium]